MKEIADLRPEKEPGPKPVANISMFFDFVDVCSRRLDKAVAIKRVPARGPVSEFSAKIMLSFRRAILPIFVDNSMDMMIILHCSKAITA